MAQVKLNSDAIWVRSIEGDKQLKEMIRGLSPGDTIDLEVDGVVGTWEKMRDGRDGRPTQGIRPIGSMRETWRSWQKERGRILHLRRPTPSDSYLRMLRPYLSEWDSPEDEEAFRDLPLE